MLNNGTIERLVEEKLEQGISQALDSLFNSYGGVMSVLKKELQAVMVPQIEGYDFSQHLTKLDAVLTEAVKQVSLPHQRLIENFQGYIKEEEIPKVIKLTDLWYRWLENVESNVETHGLDIDYDDKPTYETVEVKGTVEFAVTRRWQSRQTAQVIFECPHDEEQNIVIPLERWKNDDEGFDNEWKFSNTNDTLDFVSLRHFDAFQIYILKAMQNFSKLEIDQEEYEDEVRPNQEPEASYD